jgi:cholesterol oxidase
MVRHGTVVGADGSDRYMPHLDRLRLPLTIISGAENTCFLPDSTARTVAALSEVNGPDYYTRHLIPNYGHIDCIFGTRASIDVYPRIVDGLRPTARA